MKILSIGIDNNVLNRASQVAQRAVLYGGLLDAYAVVVPNDKSVDVVLSDKVRVLGCGGSNKVFRLWRMYQISKNLLSLEKFDVLSIQDPFETAFLSWVLARRFKLGLHIQLHGDFFSEPYWRYESVRNFFRFYLGKFILRRADAIRVVSRRIKISLVAKLGIGGEKITVVPIFSDYQVIASHPEKVGERFTFLWLGRFSREKNLPLFLRAFQSLVREDNSLLLRLIGKGLEEERIRKIIVDLNIGNNVEILDWTEDVAREYARADALVISSYYEGWGLVAIEAMSYGVPVVMTRVGCADEVIRDGENGLVVPVNNIQKLIEAMRRIQDPDLRANLRANFAEALDSLPDKEETLKLYLESWEKAKAGGKK